jgi:hypothetical protein
VSSKACESGRGDPVYVVADHLPEAVQNVLDEYDLAVVEAHNTSRGEGFAVLIARPTL